MHVYNEDFFKHYSSNLGTSTDFFKIVTHNPNNAEILTAFEHKTIDGFESKVFAICFQ
jgi:hypothetical protein